MKKKKLFGYVLTGALSLGVIGGAGVHTFAAAGKSSRHHGSEKGWNDY